MKKHDPANSLQVPPALHDALALSEIQVMTGQTPHTASTIRSQDISSITVLPSLSLYLDQKTTKRMKGLEIPLHYRVISDKKLKIGPFVGVLVARKTDQKYPLPTGREAKIYKEMTLEARKKNIFLYFFYADGVDWTHKIINGHCYLEPINKKSSWIRGSFPLPDIIYNRIAYRSLERQNNIQILINKAADASIHLFNTRFLDKWEVHKTLYWEQSTRKLLPDACLYSAENLGDFVARFKTIFIKPIDGSVGKGIIQVKVLAADLISFSKLGNKKGWQQCKSVAELYQQLNIGDENKYMLQNGINLAKIDGNIFDIRIQVQKNGYGEWTFTGAGVRIAAPGSFVTHVPNGGTKADYQTVIKEVFGDRSEVVTNLDRQLKTICRSVPRVLEQGLGISLAVLSMDLGIDENGQMWIIEINSKPASFDEDDIRQRHVSLLTDYLLYKSDFVVQ